jgi:hypothetical protein
MQRVVHVGRSGRIRVRIHHCCLSDASARAGMLLNVVDREVHGGRTIDRPPHACVAPPIRGFVTRNRLLFESRIPRFWARVRRGATASLNIDRNQPRVFLEESLRKSKTDL